MKVGLFLLMCPMFGTCAVVSITGKSRLAFAGVVMFRAVAVRILVAGEGERRHAHVWDCTNKSKGQLWYMRSPNLIMWLNRSSSFICYQPCSKHLYPCCPLETVLSGHSPQVNWPGADDWDWHCTPLKHGSPWHVSAVLPQNLPLNPSGHRHATTWEEENSL